VSSAFFVAKDSKSNEYEAKVRVLDEDITKSVINITFGGSVNTTVPI